MNKKVKCQECGYENSFNSNKCINCDENLRNYDYYKKDFKMYYHLFSQDNLDILEKIPLTDTAYDSILSIIINIGADKLPIVPQDANIEFLVDFSKCYARVQYDQENKHPNFFSYYSYNNIFLNRKIPHKIISGAIIHELSHHLFNEIIKQSIIHLLNTEKNLYIEAFAWFLTIQNKYLQITNEYISHRCQEYFLPETFMGYTSLKKIIEDNNDLDKKKIQTSLNIAESLSDDIIYILEHFIKSSNQNFQMVDRNIGYETKKLDEENKLNAIYTLIIQTFKLFCSKKREMLPVLDNFINSFIYYNI